MRVCTWVCIRLCLGGKKDGVLLTSARASRVMDIGRASGTKQDGHFPLFAELWSRLWIEPEVGVLGSLPLCCCLMISAHWDLNKPVLGSESVNNGSAFSDLWGSALSTSIVRTLGYRLSLHEDGMSPQMYFFPQKAFCDLVNGRALYSIEGKFECGNFWFNTAFKVWWDF